MDGPVQVSFVNSICTLKGGTHVKLIMDQVCKYGPHVADTSTFIVAKSCWRSKGTIKHVYLASARLHGLLG